MKDLRNVYNTIQDNLGRTIDLSLSEENLLAIGECHTFGNDYDIWLKALANNYELTIYQAALDEYHCALLFLVSGLYRQAYDSIRFCLEQTLFGLFLSVNELQFKLWERSKRDLYWSEIVNLDTGIYSQSFVASYSPEFSDIAGELCKIALQLYRELSEYIHGNPRALKLLSNRSYNFCESCFSDIVLKINSMKYLINMTFFIRYKEQLINQHTLGSLEQIIIDNIGSDPQIQAFFNAIKYEEV